MVRRSEVAGSIAVGNRSIVVAYQAACIVVGFDGRSAVTVGNLTITQIVSYQSAYDGTGAHARYRAARVAFRYSSTIFSYQSTCFRACNSRNEVTAEESAADGTVIHISYYSAYSVHPIDGAGHRAIGDSGATCFAYQTTCSGFAFTVPDTWQFCMVQSMVLAANAPTKSLPETPDLASVICRF